MSWFKDLVKRSSLANIASFLVVTVGLYLMYVSDNREMVGGIISGSLIWLYYRKPSGNASL